MNPLIDRMLQAYDVKTIYDQKNAIKEIIQEIVLCGLSRAGFFVKSAFYGGTALRIFYGLDRFSEDLDFSLLDTDLNFSLKDYFPLLEKEVASYGLNVDIIEKEKNNSSHIKSAFLKGNTKEQLLLFYPKSFPLSSLPANELIKIKFEVDINPPKYAGFEKRFRLIPVPYEVTLYDESSLFAGKLHAVIGRSWKNRIKGRDLYDFVFYISRNIPVNLPHLKARLVQSGHFKENDNLSIDDLKKLLCNKFDDIDYEQAKNDVLPFIKDAGSIALWNADFFKQITSGVYSKN